MEKPFPYLWNNPLKHALCTVMQCFTITICSKHALIWIQRLEFNTKSLHNATMDTISALSESQKIVLDVASVEGSQERVS